MSNPLLILQALDRHLSVPAEVTLFGRAALALGFASRPERFSGTKDVDCILPLPWLAAEDENVDFWLAQQRVNEELRPQGLYITHLFRELEVILQPDWLIRRVRLGLVLEKLTVYRPGTVDLVLTKMARGDDEDMEDIAFMLSQEPLGRKNLEMAFRNARVPEVKEVQDLFKKAQPKVLALAKE